VAFANAYGRVVIIGVDETDDNPKRARAIFQPHIPQISDCAERIEQALPSPLTPPLPMLEVRGILALPPEEQRDRDKVNAAVRDGLALVPPRPAGTADRYGVPKATE
jgi:hypothetical protein